MKLFLPTPPPAAPPPMLPSPERVVVVGDNGECHFDPSSAGKAPPPLGYRYHTRVICRGSIASFINFTLQARCYIRMVVVKNDKPNDACHWHFDPYDLRKWALTGVGPFWFSMAHQDLTQEFPGLDPGRSRIPIFLGTGPPKFQWWWVVSMPWWSLIHRRRRRSLRRRRDARPAAGL